MKDFKVGPGFQEGVTHGPLIHDRAVKKVVAQVEDAEKHGGKVIQGGHKMDMGETFFEPTVITGMKSEMMMMREETFGPVAGLWSFETEKEVVEMANSADVGLAGYFYSKDVARCHRVAEALEVGMVGINTGIVSDAAAPFGGVKNSGFGREGSKYGIDEYQVSLISELELLHEIILITSPDYQNGYRWRSWRRFERLRVQRPFMRYNIHIDKSHHIQSLKQS